MGGRFWGCIFEGLGRSGYGKWGGQRLYHRGAGEILGLGGELDFAGAWGCMIVDLFCLEVGNECQMGLTVRSLHLLAALLCCLRWRVASLSPARSPVAIASSASWDRADAGSADCVVFLVVAGGVVCWGGLRTLPFLRMDASRGSVAFLRASLWIAG